MYILGYSPGPEDVPQQQIEEHTQNPIIDSIGHLIERIVSYPWYVSITVVGVILAIVFMACRAYAQRKA